MLRKISAVLLASISFAFGQSAGVLDSSKVVILSNRLGPVITRLARDHFMLFGYISDFRRAVVLQRNDSTFVVRFFTGKEGFAEADTDIVYPFTTLKMMGEKVDNFEALLAGRYHMGEKLATLRFADSAVVVGAHPKPAAIPTPQERRYRFVGPIPLAPRAGYPRYRHFPSFDLTVGVRSISPDLSGLSQVYQTLPSIASPLLCIGIEVSISEEIAIQAEGAHNAAEDKVSEGWIGVAYYMHPFTDRHICPYISAGVSTCSMEIRRGIYTDAGVSGLGIQLGVEFVLGADAAIDLYGGYRFFHEISGTFFDYLTPEKTIPTSVKLGGVLFGARMKLLP